MKYYLVQAALSTSFSSYITAYQWSSCCYVIRVMEDTPSDLRFKWAEWSQGLGIIVCFILQTNQRSWLLQSTDTVKKRSDWIGLLFVESGFLSHGLFNKKMCFSDGFDCKKKNPSCNQSKAQVNRWDDAMREVLGMSEQVMVLLKREIKTFSLFIISSQLWWWAFESSTEWRRLLQFIGRAKASSTPVTHTHTHAHTYAQRVTSLCPPTNFPLPPWGNPEQSLWSALIPTGFNSTAERTS